MKSIRKLIQALFFVFAVLPVSMPVQAEEVTPLHHQSADTCKLCHKEIYKAWRTSKHAQSAPLRNALMMTFYNQLGMDGRKEDQTTKDGAYPACLNCHAPNAALDGKTKLDAMPAYAEGVNCVACHRLKGYLGAEDETGKPRQGIRAYEAGEHLQGPNGFSALEGVQEGDHGNPHLGQAIVFHGKAIPSLPLEANAGLLKTADACLGCHQGRTNPQGVSLCATGEEYAASKSLVECLACHMAPQEGIADHGMGMSKGMGQERARLKQSLLLGLGLESKGTSLLASLSLSNKVPHGIPTGTPFKSLALRLKAYDAQGGLIWESQVDDPRMLLSLELIDEAGHSAMPQSAAAVKHDSRLQPFESRKIEVEIPGAGVALVRAELYYQPLWSRLVKAMPGLPQELSVETLVAWAEAKPAAER
jgi:hypothetical protein